MTGKLWRTIAVFTLLLSAGFSWGDEQDAAPKPARKISRQKLFYTRVGDREPTYYRGKALLRRANRDGWLGRPVRPMERVNAAIERVTTEAVILAAELCQEGRTEAALNLLYRLAGCEGENSEATNALERIFDRTERKRSFYCPPGGDTQECEEWERIGIDFEGRAPRVIRYLGNGITQQIAPPVSVYVPDGGWTRWGTVPPSYSPCCPVDEAPCCATGRCQSDADKCAVCPAAKTSVCPNTCCQTEKVCPAPGVSCVTLAVCATACGCGEKCKCKVKCGCGDKCCCKEKCGCGEKCKCSKTSASVHCPHPARHTGRPLVCVPQVIFSCCPVTYANPVTSPCHPVASVCPVTSSCCPATGSCCPVISVCPGTSSCCPLASFCYPLTDVSGSVVSVCPVIRDPRARVAEDEDRVACDEVQEVVEIRFASDGEITRRRYEVRRYLHSDGRNASRTTSTEDCFDWISRRVPYNQPSDQPMVCPDEWRYQP